MTWGARIAKGDGTLSTTSQYVCGECKHGGLEMEGMPYRNGHAVCNVQGAAAQLASVLTSIDVGADSHMAAGNLVLWCNGFEQK